MFYNDCFSGFLFLVIFCSCSSTWTYSTSCGRVAQPICKQRPASPWQPVANEFLIQSKHQMITSDPNPNQHQSSSRHKSNRTTPRSIWNDKDYLSLTKRPTSLDNKMNPPLTSHYSAPCHPDFLLLGDPTVPTTEQLRSRAAW